MQKFQMHECADDRHLPPVEVYKVSDVATHVDELNAEIESLKAQLDNTKRNCSAFENEMGNLQVANGKLIDERDEALRKFKTEEIIANGWEAKTNTLRDILKLLVPDLKLMAAAAQAMGNHARAQALNNICKGVEL